MQSSINPPYSPTLWKAAVLRVIYPAEIDTWVTVTSVLMIVHTVITAGIPWVVM